MSSFFLKTMPQGTNSKPLSRSLLPTIMHLISLKPLRCCKILIYSILKSITSCQHLLRDLATDVLRYGSEKG